MSWQLFIDKTYAKVRIIALTIIHFQRLISIYLINLALKFIKCTLIKAMIYLIGMILVIFAKKKINYETSIKTGV